MFFCHEFSDIVSTKKRSGQRRSFSSRFIKQRLFAFRPGQIVVEYILLLSIAVGLATLIVVAFVGRGSDQPGFLITKWMEISRIIGLDTPDDIDRSESPSNQSN